MRLSKIALAVAIVSLSAPVALAEPTYGTAKVDPAFVASVARVCSDATLKRTPAADAACKSEAFPAIVAAGNAFANRGLGAEFNALIRQLPLAVAVR